jgi:hypothetical protein
MSLLPFPFVRKGYPGIDNPVYTNDLIAGNQQVWDGLSALLNLTSTGFAIISGMAYTSGAPGSYAPGIFWLAGSFYPISTITTEGQYLTGGTMDTQLQGFDDGNARNIYTLNVGSATANNTGTGPYSPVLSGNMGNYRLGASDMNANIQSLLATQALLGNAAFLNVGMTAGTVAAGNDSRFGYSTAQSDARYAQISKVLIEGSGNNSFVPSGPYDPATKSYVDSLAAGVLARGAFTLPSQPTTGGTVYTVPISGVTTINYLPFVQIVNLSGAGAGDTAYAAGVQNFQTGSFDVRLVATGSESINISIVYILFATT